LPRHHQAESAGKTKQKRNNLITWVTSRATSLWGGSGGQKKLIGDGRDKMTGTGELGDVAQ